MDEDAGAGAVEETLVGSAFGGSDRQRASEKAFSGMSRNRRTLGR